MISYAIKNLKTGKFMWGTDYRYNPPHQRTSDKTAMLYPSYSSAALDFGLRRCGKHYDVVPVTVNEIVEEYDGGAVK